MVCGGGIAEGVARILFGREGEEEGSISIEMPDGQRHVVATQDGRGVLIVT